MNRDSAFDRVGKKVPKETKVFVEAVSAYLVEINRLQKELDLLIKKHTSKDEG